MSAMPKLVPPGPQPADSPPAAGAPAPASLPGERLAKVAAILRDFLQTWVRDLGDYLVTPISGELGGCRLTDYSEFARTTGNNGCLIVMETAPGPGTLLLALPAGLLFRVLSVMSGGPANLSAPFRAALTEIEIQILREFFERLQAELEAAWSCAGIRLKRLGIKPLAALETFAEGGQALVMQASLLLGDAPEPLYLAVPPWIARLRAAASAAEPGRARSPVREDLRAALSRAKVDVEAVLAGSTLRLSDLLALKPGSVVTLNQPANTPLECLVNRRAKFLGELVQVRERAALLIGPAVRTGETGAPRG